MSEAKLKSSGKLGRQMWTGGRLRNRIIVLLLAILTPLLVIFAYYTVQTQRQDLENTLLEKAKGTAISGAATIGNFWENAIENGALTQEQVFDQNYVMFQEFDPVMDPAFDSAVDGDPQTYDKYHTAYDAYTDEHWQALLDSFLTSEDITYTVATDVNGYLPTHNTRYNTGDGSAATDRTKRLFNDSVGIQAARNTEPILQQVYQRPGTGETLWDVSAPIYVNGEHWGSFRVGIQLAQNQQRIIAATWRSVITSSILILVLIIVAWFLGRYISLPLEHLTTVATKAAEGDLQQQIEIPGRDEITTLADAFNTMITRLREFIGTLEGRVAARTKDLAIVAEVSTATATILETDRLLQAVVDLTKERFNLYHSHIYLFDQAGENLVLTSGAGEPGRRMVAEKRSIPLNSERSLVARAARERKGVTVNDVRQAPDFLPNPLLPNTRSELAVPMIVGGNVIGVFDVQSDQVGRFTDSDIDIQTTLAAQVATSIQNVRSFEQSKTQAELETLVNTIGQKIQRTATVEDTLQTAIREIGLALGASRVSARIQSSRQPELSKENME